MFLCRLIITYMVIELSTFNAKVIFAGDPATGKTCLIRRFVDNFFNQSYLPTLGFEISVKPLQIASQTIIFSVWDVEGQKTFDNFRLRYYQGSQGFLLAFDMTARETFENLNKWFAEIKEICPHAPIVLVGNKYDLPMHIVTTEEIIVKVEEFGAAGFVLTSAKTGEGVLDAFTMLGKSIIDIITGPPLND